jgi:hypothetical protein
MRERVNTFKGMLSININQKGEIYKIRFNLLDWSVFLKETHFNNNAVF